MLDSYGWSETLQQQFLDYAARGLSPARVIVQQRGLYVLATSMGEATAQLSGRFAHEAEAGAYPVAGDWVAAAIRPEQATATIHHLLPRRGAFTRKAAGGGPAAQVVAANVDVALLIASLNADLNPRRIERYLATAWESGASPVVVLTKADLCQDCEARKAEIEAVALGVPVHVVSVVTGEGLEVLRDSLAPGQTAALVGSSGAGKSSLVNALAGAPLMATQAIREGDARGRHTTTHRQLVLLPNGRLVLDTPGMRELGLWDADSGVAATFADVEALVAACRFSDCAHETEPGCAIRAALADGTLDEDRWRSYAKLQRELAHLAQGRSAAAGGAAQGLDPAGQELSRAEAAADGGRLRSLRRLLRGSHHRPDRMGGSKARDGLRAHQQRASGTTFFAPLRHDFLCAPSARRGDDRLKTQRRHSRQAQRRAGIQKRALSLGRGPR